VRQLTNVLLSHTKSVCLLTDEDESAAQACYLRAGFKLREFYQSVFLQPETSETEN
jgi:predicted GNAT family acetyltransferase